MEKRDKYNTVFITFFIAGLIMYLTGLVLLIIYIVSALNIFSFLKFTDNVISLVKILGIILFSVGFILFIIAVIRLYKFNAISDSNKDLIIEGKADVITIMITTYLMLLMLVTCLIFDDIIGAVLFAIVIGVQSLINTILFKYFSKKAR